MSYSSNIHRCIATIIKVNKSSFKINAYGSDDYLFSVINGNRKGLHGRKNMSVVSRCELLTDKEAIDLKEKWKAAKEKKELLNLITDALPKLNNEQLVAIKIIIEL